MDQQIVELWTRACKDFSANAEGSNPVDAARAIERALQLQLRTFRDIAPGRVGALNHPDTKAFAELTLGELIQASFTDTKGDSPTVPVRYLQERAGNSFSEGLWLRESTITQVASRVRIDLSHSKLVPDGSDATSEASPEAKFRLIECAIGVAHECGNLSPGILDDLESMLQRKLARSPSAPPSRDPIGISSLPSRPYSKLIGRDKELSQVIKKMEGPNAIFSIEGEGGIGKSALAWASCEKLQSRGSFGAMVWVSGKVRSLTVKGVQKHVGYLSGPVDLYARIAAVLGVPRSPDLDIMRADVHDFMNRTRTLVVIDNWEDIPPAAQEAVGALVSHCAALFTSRPNVGTLHRVVLRPLSEFNVTKLLREEARVRLGQNLHVDEHLSRIVAEATRGNPLGIWWIVERIRLGSNLLAAAKELARQEKNLLAYCYGSLFEQIGGAGRTLARYLVASAGSIRIADLVAMGLDSDYVRNGVMDLASMNVVSSDDQFHDEVSLLPLCYKYLDIAWSSAPEMAEVLARVDDHASKASDLERALRDGPFGCQAIGYYQASKETDSVEPSEAFLREHPEDLWAIHYCGVANRLTNNRQRAQELANQAVTIIEPILDRVPQEAQSIIYREFGYLHTRHDDNRPEAALERIEDGFHRSNNPVLGMLLAELVSRRSMKKEAFAIAIDIVERSFDQLSSDDQERLVVTTMSSAIGYPSYGDPSRRTQVLRQAAELVDTHITKFYRLADQHLAAQLFGQLAKRNDLPIGERLRAVETALKWCLPDTHMSVFDRDSYSRQAVAARPLLESLRTWLETLVVEPPLGT